MASVHHNLVGLARVSTAGQDAQLQRDALNVAGCGRVFEVTVSTRKTLRPGLAAALDHLRPGDTLAVWKLDRLGRSVKDVLSIADDVHERGVGLRVLTGTLAGTFTPTGEGKFFFTMMAAFAELERDLIHERTVAGLAAARAHHRIGGRPTVMDADRLAAAQACRAKGQSPTQIAQAIGVSRATIYRHLAAGEPIGAEEARPEDAAPAPRMETVPVPQPTTNQKPRARQQRWYLVEASSEDLADPVVVISGHRTEKAATTARSRVRQRATGPGATRYEVRPASSITTRYEWDPVAGRGVVRDGPPT